MKTKHTINIGDRVIAINYLSGIPESFMVLGIRENTLDCTSLDHEVSTIWTIKKNMVLGHSDL